MEDIKEVYVLVNNSAGQSFYKTEVIEHMRSISDPVSNFMLAVPITIKVPNHRTGEIEDDTRTVRVEREYINTTRFRSCYDIYITLFTSKEYLERYFTREKEAHLGAAGRFEDLIKMI